MEILSNIKCFEGNQLRIKHYSRSCRCDMTFSLYLPPQAKHKPVPLVTWLSGLTCSDENFVNKAGAQQFASLHGLALCAPDTSPRGDKIPDDPEKAWDFGQGAGFYLDAVKVPWNQHYNMYSYITQDLQHLLLENKFSIDFTRQGIFGHSMGGHGALTVAIKNPNIYSSVSAFAPICAPSQCAWGEKAFSNYLGDDKQTWLKYDACALIERKGYEHNILIDQGTKDDFLEHQLKPQLLQQACEKTNIKHTLRYQQGYDHSYFFIASFIGEHMAHHAKNLCQ